MGVKYLRLIMARLPGRCPLRAPTKNKRDEANMPLGDEPQRVRDDLNALTDAR